MEGVVRGGQGPGIQQEVMEEMRNGYHHARQQFKKGLKVRINSEVDRAACSDPGGKGGPGVR